MSEEPYRCLRNNFETRALCAYRVRVMDVAAPSSSYHPCDAEVSHSAPPSLLIWSLQPLCNRVGDTPAPCDFCDCITYPWAAKRSNISVASPPLHPRQQALGDTAYNEMIDRGYMFYYEQRSKRYTARFYTTWPRKDYSLLLAWRRLESASLSLFRLC